MANKSSPAIWSSLIAVLLGLLAFYPTFIFRLLILALLAVVGYAIGKLLESSERRARLRELFSELFRFR
jgi:hypothetical protein